MHQPDAFPTGIKSTLAILLRHTALIAAMLAGWLLPDAKAQTAAPSGRIETSTLPEGAIERRSVQFEAPEPACESYHESFRERL